ncbi:MAG: type II toxin-antitoxin system RelE/ParE family toxin [Rhodanobacteraceae bacterium]
MIPLHRQNDHGSLLEVAGSLALNPERDSHPRELLVFGHREYRQILMKPWRVIYGVEPNRVVVYVITDGRRDMRSQLTQRLLGA